VCRDILAATPFDTRWAVLPGVLHTYPVWGGKCAPPHFSGCTTSFFSCSIPAYPTRPIGCWCAHALFPPPLSYCTRATIPAQAPSHDTKCITGVLIYVIAPRPPTPTLPLRCICIDCVRFISIPTLWHLTRLWLVNHILERSPPNAESLTCALHSLVASLLGKVVRPSMLLRPAELPCVASHTSARSGLATAC